MESAPSRKRRSSWSDDRDSKRKLSCNDTLESLEIITSAGNTVKLEKQELEDIVLKQMYLALQENGVTGVMERKLAVTEQQLDRSIQRTLTLAKQVDSLNAVLKAYVTKKSQSNEKFNNRPEKILRSVGVQVEIIDHGNGFKDLVKPFKVEVADIKLGASDKQLDAADLKLEPKFFMPKFSPAEAKKVFLSNQHNPIVLGSSDEDDSIDSIEDSDESGSEDMFCLHPVKKSLSTSTNLLLEEERKKPELPSLPERFSFTSLENGMDESPPKPTLNVSRISNFLALSWDIHEARRDHTEISCYIILILTEDLQKTATSPLRWKKLPEVAALPLPMSCRIPMDGSSEHLKLHFAIQAKDVNDRTGPYSNIVSVIS